MTETCQLQANYTWKNILHITHKNNMFINDLNQRDEDILIHDLSHRKNIPKNDLTHRKYRPLNDLIHRRNIPLTDLSHRKNKNHVQKNIPRNEGSTLRIFSTWTARSGGLVLQPDR